MKNLEKIKIFEKDFYKWKIVVKIKEKNILRKTK